MKLKSESNQKCLGIADAVSSMVADLEAEKVRSVGLVEQLTQEKLRYVEDRCQQAR